MEYKIIEFKNEEKYINEFLKLPKRLYSKREIMQDEREEKEILMGTHILSKYFRINNFLILNERERAVARAIVTFYDNDKTAYVGYYECIENIDVSNMLLKYIEKYVKNRGYEKIIGPLNCSFWIGYRFKLDNFSHPYIGEPYNKPYYPQFFKEAGYEIYQEYSSNIFDKVNKAQDNVKFSDRLKKMKCKGYKFITPTRNTFNEQLKDIGKMILKLYSNFPGYKEIELNDFYNLYKDLDKIVDFSMIKLSYYNDKMVGFFVAIPNYKNFVCRKNYLKIILNKFVKKEYILMYLGVEKEHLGLGRALAESMKEELKKNGATSIGALIKTGNANKVYFKELIKDEYKYVLLYKKLY